MYKQSKKSSTAGKQGQGQRSQNYNDLLVFTPSLVNNLAWPSVHFFDGELTAAVKNNFYEIGGMRGHCKFLSRDS